MELGGVVMAAVVLPIMGAIAVVAVLWPAPLARWNAAALRTLPVAAPRGARNRAAAASSPKLMRVWGIAALALLAVIVPNVVARLVTRGIEPASGGDLSPMLAWAGVAVGLAQALFGLFLIVRSGSVLTGLRERFAADGDSLRRWMIIVWGSVGLIMSGTTFFVVLA